MGNSGRSAVGLLNWRRWQFTNAIIGRNNAVPEQKNNIERYHFFNEEYFTQVETGGKVLGFTDASWYKWRWNR